MFAMPVRIAAFAAALALAACTSSTDPRSTDESAPSPSSATTLLYVERVGEAIRLTNSTDRDIWFDAMTKDVRLLVAWKPCVGESHCRRVKRGEQVDLPFQEVTGYAGKSTQATIFWWNLDTGRDGKPVAGRVRTVDVEL